MYKVTRRTRRWRVPLTLLDRVGSRVDSEVLVETESVKRGLGTRTPTRVVSGSRRPCDFVEGRTLYDSLTDIECLSSTRTFDGILGVDRLYRGGLGRGRRDEKTGTLV